MQTRHVTRSHVLAGGYGIGYSPRRECWSNMINYNDGTVNGVDIMTPVFNFSETHYIDQKTVTDKYKYDLFWLAAKTPINKYNFRGWEPGEVMFLGASGSMRGNDDWEITFKFQASPNVKSFTVVSSLADDNEIVCEAQGAVEYDDPNNPGKKIKEIRHYAKEGFDYVWIHYSEDVDNVANKIIKQPELVFVEMMYLKGDFSVLQIGA